MNKSFAGLTSKQWREALRTAFVFGLLSWVLITTLIMLFVTLCTLLGAFDDWNLVWLWAIKLDYVLASLALIAGGWGLIFGGKEYQGSILGAADDDDIEDLILPRSWYAGYSFSWPVNVLCAAVLWLLCTTGIDCIF